jgi:uncharacterized protein (TIGR03067 family)
MFRKSSMTIFSLLCSWMFPLVVGSAEPVGDAKAIQGEWRTTQFEEEGKKEPPDKVNDLVYEFSDDRLRVKRDGKVMVEGTFSLDSSKTPKHIDMLVAGDTGRGIYKIEMDRLVICFPAFKTNKKRPSDFVTKAGSRTMLAVLERVKPGAVGSHSPFDKKESLRSYKVRINSKLVATADKETLKLGANTEIRYQWKQKGDEKTLSFSSIKIRADTDGKESMNSSMNRSRYVVVNDGTRVEISSENASDELKKLLFDGFDAPICKLRIDDQGKEVKRTVVAGPGAKSLVDNGVIANAVLFHPPFSVHQDEWQSAVAFPMVNGGYAIGNLTYKKLKQEKQLQTVNAFGTLTNDNVNVPETNRVMKGIRYEVTGQQTYDQSRKGWVSGNMSIEMSFQMTADGKVVSTSKGTLVLDFEEEKEK